MNSRSLSIRGFTLVELMVVIVVMALITSIVMVNMRGTDHRKAMQAREVFILELKKINRESSDQAKILALDFKPSLDGTAMIYSVNEYQNNIKPEQNMNNQATTAWTPYLNFQEQTLPDRVSIDIQPTDHRFDGALNETLLNANAPKLIWLGNGEVKPVNIQFYLEQQPVGDVIQIDYLGKVNES
jgi:general secretion pathway protein G